MRAAAAKGFINATDCADYLVKKGLPFRDAYKITGSLVALCIDSGQDSGDPGPGRVPGALRRLFDEDVYDAISLETCVMTRNAMGGPRPGQRGKADQPGHDRTAGGVL